MTVNAAVPLTITVRKRPLNSGWRWFTRAITSFSTLSGTA